MLDEPRTNDSEGSEQFEKGYTNRYRFALRRKQGSIAEYRRTWENLLPGVHANVVHQHALRESRRVVWLSR